MSTPAAQRASKRRKELRARAATGADVQKLRQAVNELSRTVKAQESRLAHVALDLQAMRTAAVIAPLTLPQLIRECMHRCSTKELVDLGWNPSSAANLTRMR